MHRLHRLIIELIYERLPVSATHLILPTFSPVASDRCPSTHGGKIANQLEARSKEQESRSRLLTGTSFIPYRHLSSIRDVRHFMLVIIRLETGRTQE